MPKPQSLNDYLKELYEWQKRVNNRLSRLEDKAGGHQDDDPPPPPPDLG